MRRVTARPQLVLVYVLLALIAFMPFVPSGRNVTAASSLTLQSTVQLNFPNAMTFGVKAQSSVNVISLRLHYVVDRQNVASVTGEGWAEFTPSTSVNAQWVWDMRRSSLPAGGQVEYWWTGIDSAGNQAQTSVARVSFDDTRYKWQSLTSGAVTLLWYNGNQTFANTLMAAAQQGLQQLQADTGAAPQRTVRIYVYGSQQDLLGGLVHPQEWTGGVAFPEHDIIAIGIEPGQLDWGTRAIRHELTHWVADQITYNNYGAGMPVWLNEGLATYGEGPATPQNQGLIAGAVQSNSLISVRSLSSPFSANSGLAFLSYAESQSIVAFLIKAYGRDKMNQLLGVFHQGATYDEALKQVYGFDQDGLDIRWKQSLGAKTSFAPVTYSACAAAFA